MATLNYQEALDRVGNYKKDSDVERDPNKFYERGGNEVTYAESLQMRGGGAGAGPGRAVSLPKTQPATGGPEGSAGGKPNPNTDQQNAGQANAGSGSGAAGTSIQGGQTPGGNATYGGVTDYNQISQQFQNWNPTSDWGKTMQATYMMNTLQSYNDMQQAQSMAFTNAGIQMDMMTATAALELANKGALLNAEQQAALNMMGAQFDYESRFAQDDYNRDVGRATLGTDLQIQLMQAQGDQTRANYQVQGYEERMGTMEEGNQTRLTQAQANLERQQQAAQAAQLGMDTAAFQQGLQKDSAGYIQGLQKDTSKFEQELSKDSAAFNQALQKDSDTHRSGIRKDEAGYGSELRIGEAQVGSGLRKDEARLGSELRKDEAVFGSDLRMKEADYANRLEARTRADMSKRSVGRARGF